MYCDKFDTDLAAAARVGEGGFMRKTFIWTRRCAGWRASALQEANKYSPVVVPLPRGVRARG